MTDPQRCPRPTCHGVLQDGRCPACGWSRGPVSSAAHEISTDTNAGTSTGVAASATLRPSAVPQVTHQPVAPPPTIFSAATSTPGGPELDPTRPTTFSPAVPPASPFTPSVSPFTSPAPPAAPPASPAPTAAPPASRPTPVAKPSGGSGGASSGNPSADGAGTGGAGTGGAGTGGAGTGGAGTGGGAAGRGVLDETDGDHEAATLPPRPGWSGWSDEVGASGFPTAPPPTVWTKSEGDEGAEPPARPASVAPARCPAPRPGQNQLWSAAGSATGGRSQRASDTSGHGAVDGAGSGSGAGTGLVHGPAGGQGTSAGGSGGSGGEPAASGRGTGGSGGASGRSGSGSVNGPGAGLVELPAVERPDPASLLLIDPRLPLRLRVCRGCGEPVGRARAGQQALAEGFCAGCGQPYSLRPSLRPGDQIGRYEIEGVLAHGTHGWTYLALDHSAEAQPWVVFRGLCTSPERDVRVAAMAERGFLTELDHPGIAKAHTCLEHGDTSYLVTEHVSGLTLRDMQRRRQTDVGRPDPLPVTAAIAYVMAALPALEYLHRRGLVYGDVRPDTIMASGHQVRLVDLRAIQRLQRRPGSGRGGAAMGALGFQAPEVGTDGPSVAGDLYAVGRTLAALALDLRGFTSTYRFSLPPATAHTVLARHESLTRLLAKTTARDPARRFASATELHGELLGVLREIVAAERGRPLPAPVRSTRFGPDASPDSGTGTGGGAGTGGGTGAGGELAGPWPVLSWRVLPQLLAEPADPAAAALATLPDVPPAQLADLLAALGAASPAARLRLADLHIRTGARDAARTQLSAIAADDPRQWRVHWLRGLLLLAEDDAAAASSAFEQVYDEVPGELAPKLALAVAAESAGNPDRARVLYDLVSRTDSSFASAAFGLARLRLAAGDRTGALEAYRRVTSTPNTPDAHLRSRIHLVRALGVAGDDPATPTLAGLRSASAILAELDLPPATRAALTRDLLTDALRLLRSGAQAPDPGTEIAGTPLQPVPVRLGLEHAYRTLARHAPTRHERHHLVDLANRIRPRTLL